MWSRALNPRARPIPRPLPLRAVGYVSLLLSLVSMAPLFASPIDEELAAVELSFELLEAELDHRLGYFERALRRGMEPSTAVGDLAGLDWQLQALEARQRELSGDPGQSAKAFLLGREIYNLSRALALGVRPPEQSVVLGAEQTKGLGSTISGTVTFETTGAPIESADVSVYDAAGFFVRSGSTGPLGLYSIGGLGAGDYFLTTNGFGFVSELYDDIACDTAYGSSCVITDGTPITVPASGTVSGIDFALQLGGSISGRIRQSNGQGVACQAEVYDSSGAFVCASSTDSSGFYNVSGLAPGDFFVRTDCSLFSDELFDDLPCEPSCDVTTGDSIAVSASLTTANIDFVLEARGTLSGTLTSESSGKPLIFTSVRIFDEAGDLVRVSSTDSLGRYEEGLLEGDYFVLTSTSFFSGYVDELYDDIPCESDCEVTKGDLVTVSLGQATEGINFALGQKGRISGSVLDAHGSSIGSSGFVQVWSDEGDFVDNTGSFGSSYTTDFLDAGTYFLTAMDHTGFQDQLYQLLPCTPSSCLPTAGTPVTVEDSTLTSGVDFLLQPAGAVLGRITDRETGIPVQGVTVHLRSKGGATNLLDLTPFEGGFAFTDLELGTYTLWAEMPGSYFPQLYDGLPCPDTGCDPALGTPIVLDSVGPTLLIDIELGPVGIFQDSFESGELGAWAQSSP